MFAEDDIERRRLEREAADRAYNEALTALDQAFPRLPELPHPPRRTTTARCPDSTNAGALSPATRRRA